MKTKIQCVQFSVTPKFIRVQLKPEEKSPTESEPVVGRPRHRADGGGEHDVPGPDQVWLLYRAQEVT